MTPENHLLKILKEIGQIEPFSDYVKNYKTWSVKERVKAVKHFKTLDNDQFGLFQAIAYWLINYDSFLIYSENKNSKVALHYYENLIESHKKIQNLKLKIQN